LSGLLPYDLPGLAFHRLLTVIGALDSEVRRIIEQKRRSGRTGDDMLAVLLHARDGESGLALSEDELIGHASVFFVAGHETTANALTWTVFLLSQHPDVSRPT
jgi:cytochrome P450